MLVVPPRETAPERPGLEGIGVQAAAGIGDGQIDRPERDEAHNEKRHGPARLDAVEPAQERPPPSRRRAIGPLGHRPKCKINRHGTQMQEGSDAQTAHIYFKPETNSND
jgi:hypothetical protein